MKRIIALYKPNNQKIGIATTTDNITGKKLKFLNNIISSNLIKYASHTQIIHREESIIIAIVLLEYLFNEL